MNSEQNVQPTSESGNSTKPVLAAVFTEGEICLAWYPKTGIIKDGLDLYWCKILRMGNQYCTAELYFGEEYNPKQRKGKFNDVCIADLVKADVNGG